MLGRQHVHEVSGETSYDYGHLHYYSGTTGPARGTGPGHTHHIHVATTIVLEYYHMIDVETGPAVPGPYGHVHQFRGITTANSIPPGDQSSANPVAVSLEHGAVTRGRHDRQSWPMTLRT